jgi:hypothetical protein
VGGGGGGPSSADPTYKEKLSLKGKPLRLVWTQGV